MKIKCVVAATNSCGEPDFYLIYVSCSQAEYNNGDHCKAARSAAEENDFEGEMVVFDENYGPQWLFDQFDWVSALCIAVP